MSEQQDSVDDCIVDIASRFSAIDPAVEGVVDRVARISKYIGRAFEETLAGHGLNHGEYKLLLRLATRSQDNRMSAGDLSRALLLSSGAMTNRLDRLEAAGHVRRVPDPKDRRGVLVEMTEQGHRSIEEAVTEQAAKEIDVFAMLDRDELGTLNVLLRKVLSSLERDEATPETVTAPG